MKVSDLMRAMSEAGAPMEAILIAVQAIEEGQDAIAQRRAAERDRKRRQRAGTVTGQSRDTDGTVTDAPALSPSPNEINSNPHPHTHPDMNTRAQGPWDDHVSVWLKWRETHPFPRPWWAPKQVWADWIDVRKAKRARNTITAHNGFLTAIDKHTDPEWPPPRLLEHAVAHSWISIHRPEERRNDRTNVTHLRPGSQQGPDRRSSLARAIDEGIENLEWLQRN